MDKHIKICFQIAHLNQREEHIEQPTQPSGWLGCEYFKSSLSSQTIKNTHYEKIN